MKNKQIYNIWHSKCLFFIFNKFARISREPFFSLRHYGVLYTEFWDRKLLSPFWNKALTRENAEKVKLCQSFQEHCIFSPIVSKQSKHFASWLTISIHWLGCASGFNRFFLCSCSVSSSPISWNSALHFLSNLADVALLT